MKLEEASWHCHFGRWHGHPSDGGVRVFERGYSVDVAQSGREAPEVGWPLVESGCR